MKNRSGLFVVMGVSGCGKSTVAGLLAERTGGFFLDADDFHPPENRTKMAAGIPLTDEDRSGWLQSLNAVLKEHAHDAVPVFLACSALRQSYRDRLAQDLPALEFVYLKGSPEVIRTRLEQRSEHFMPASLLESQFATLEEPSDALVLDIREPIPVLVDCFLQKIREPLDL